MNEKLVKSWLESAYYDLENVRFIVDQPHLTHLCAFHAQQCIEKAFKAMIVSKQNKLPKKHDLLMLKSMIKDSLEVENEEILEDLNQLYIESRYPGEMGLLPDGKPTIEDAKTFYHFADEMLKKTCKTLNITCDDIWKNTDAR